MIDTLRELTARLRAFFSKPSRDSDFDAELQSHLDLAIQHHLNQGHTPAEAKRLAHLQLGTRDNARELHRENRGLPFLDQLQQDIRYTFRTLKRDAALATFAILIIGLGVGASATVFSVVNALLLQPLPFRQPERLVWVAHNGGVGLSSQTAQVGYIIELRRQSKAFSDIAAYFAFYGVGDSKLTAHGEPERLTNVPVTQNFFPVLGVNPILGRNFTQEESALNGPPAVMLSYRLWQRRFASDPAIIGRQISLNEQSTTVIGVLPPTFDFASTFAPGSTIDLFSPFPIQQELHRYGNTSAIVARLNDNFTLDNARAELNLFRQRMDREHPDWNGFIPSADMLHHYVSGRFRPAMVLLACAVGLVMLIVSANLSNLLLARAATRHREIGIRAALGAAKSRLVRQMLTESLVLSSAGALLGIALAAIGIRIMSNLDSMGIPLLANVAIDARVLAFSLALAIATGLLFGLAPALRASRGAINNALNESSRSATEGRSHGYLRGILVAGELAMACVLLTGAGLLLRSFLQVLDVDLGFQPHSAVAMRVDAARQFSTNQESRNAYYDRALALARQIPAVSAAGLSDSLPLGTNRTWGVAAKGVTYTPQTYPEAFVRIVSDGYLPAMGMQLIDGRDFTEHDRAGSQPVIIINESLAQRLWPGQNAVGRVLKTDRPERVVVGVVRNVRHLALEQQSGNEMYLPIRQTNDYANVTIVVRGNRPTNDLAATVRTTLRQLDPNLPGNDVRTLEGLVNRSVSPRRFLVLLLTGFAVFAVILASLGIYGVISYSVNQRRQEIGIRMALGASAAEVRKTVLLQTLRLAAIGMTIGLTAAALLSRTLQGLLYNTTPTDPTTYAAVIALLITIAAIAGYLPAHRASKVNPTEALRAAGN